MTNARYDEFQLANRHRIAFQTLIIVMALLMINGYIKNFYGVWAPALLEMLVLMYIPMMYFVLMSIVKNAYLRRKDQPVLYIVLFAFAAIMGLFSVVPSIVNGTFVFIENGQLTDRIGSLFITTFAGGTSVALLIRRIRNRRVLDKEE